MGCCQATVEKDECEKLISGNEIKRYNNDEYQPIEISFLNRSTDEHKQLMIEDTGKHATDESDLNQSIRKHKQMMLEAKIESNLETFERCDSNSVDKCDGDIDNKNPIMTCNVLKRLHQSLIYYDKLDIINNQLHQKLFEHFTHEIYHQIIDDFIHLHNEHGHQLQHINEQLEECNIGKCPYTTRHHSVSDKSTHNGNKSSNLNATVTFYMQIMDSLHFYLHHCFHVGLRARADSDANATDEKQNVEYFDAVFSRINKMTLERQHITKHFDRFSTKKNNKFNIKTQEEEMENNNDE
eukprot:353404_1